MQRPGLGALEVHARPASEGTPPSSAVPPSVAEPPGPRAGSQYSRAAQSAEVRHSRPGVTHAPAKHTLLAPQQAPASVGATQRSSMHASPARQSAAEAQRARTGPPLQSQPASDTSAMAASATIDADDDAERSGAWDDGRRSTNIPPW